MAVRNGRKQREEQEHRVLDNALEMHFLNLSKVREEDLGELKNWLVFIQTNDRKERAKMAEGNMTLEKANEVMERFYSDKEARKKYEAALKQEADWRLFEMEFERRGMERGMEQGIEQGIQMTNLNIAKNMYDLGYSKEEIEKITGVVL